MASNLQQLAAKARESSRKGRYGEKEARHLQQTVDEFEKGRGSFRDVQQAMKAFDNARNRRRLQMYERRKVNRPDTPTPSTQRELERVARKLGPIGRVIIAVANKASQNLTESEMRAAVQVVRQMSRGQGDMEPAIKALDSAGLPMSESIAEMFPNEGRISRKQAGPAESAMEAVGHIEGTHPQERLNETRMSELTLTPQSSNVYSFQYDFLKKTLYVRFKAPIINQSAVTNYRSKGGRRSMAGDLGRTIKGKTDEPGPLYAYLGVPVELYQKIIQQDSAGGAVWDFLRVRGSIWGHQFQYTLVASNKVPGENGQPAVYVPRKATKTGFRSRSLAVPGAGKRRFANSTLPEQRINRGGTINRGGPNRGRPNRGR